MIVKLEGKHPILYKVDTITCKATAVLCFLFVEINCYSLSLDKQANILNRENLEKSIDLITKWSQST